MSDTVKNMIETIGKMSILEVTELVKAMEEEFGVSAAAPVAVAAAPAAGGDAGGAAEEKTEFNVLMKSFGGNKIAVIKVVRAQTGLALKEAKDLVEGVPSTVKENLPKDEAEKMVAELKEAGAEAELA